MRNPRREAAEAGAPNLTKSRRRGAPAGKTSLVKGGRRSAPAKRGAGAGRRPTNARGGPPQRTTFKGILLRAGIVAALFYPYIIFVGDLNATQALYTTAFVFIILVPLGFLMDSLFYKIRLRKYEKRKSGG